jgi:hydroxymethylpyrimidine pyrophosphatase-like HAD family hydrolase
VTAPPAPGTFAVFDIDGCLVPKRGEDHDLAALTALRRISQAAGGRAFTFATGRAAMYALAFAELLDVRSPVLAEHGALLLSPESLAVTWTSEAARQAWPEVREQALRRLAPILRDVRLEPFKAATLSLHPLRGTVAETERRLGERLGGLPLRLHPSHIAVDVAFADVDKGNGLSFLLARLGVPEARCLAVGDSVGDLPMLARAGFAAAPANAAEPVRRFVRSRGPKGFLASRPFTAGVLEALLWFFAAVRSETTGAGDATPCR